MRLDSKLLVPLLAVAVAGGAACGDVREAEEGESADEAAEIAADLEKENGGLTMDDEAPLFDDADSFADAEIEDTSVYEDPFEEDPEVTDTIAGRAGAYYQVAVLWGQMPPDREAEVAVDWSGTLSINRGAMLIRRVVAFEDETDAVDARTDRRSISFTSVTRPHADGFRLVVLDPEPTSDEPLVLTYTPNSGAAFSVDIAALLEGPQSHEVDDLGNRLVAVAMRRPADACDNGFVRGRWHRVRPGRGRLYGQVSDDEGELIGHVRGVFGQRRNGDNVFFGKFIDLAGEFRGIFGGTFGDGRFRGRWIVRADPDRGVVAGEFRENDDARGIGGHFLGRWAETSCNIRLDR